MTSEDRAAQISAMRQRILVLLRPYPDGMSLPAVRSMLGALGYGRLTPDELELELQYLADKGWISRASRPLIPQLQFYRITAAGVDQLPLYEL